MKITTTLIALASLGISTAQAAISHWETASGNITSNVTSSTNGGAGFTLNGTGGIAYDYGSLDQLGSKPVDGSTIEFIFNLTDSGASIVIGSTGGWSPGSEGLAFKLEQWNNTGKFGITAPGVHDSTLDTNSLFSQDVHAVLRRNNGGTMDLFINGALVETDDQKTNWRMDGGSGYIGSSTNGTTDPATGTVYGVASYDTALSNAEITTLYNAYAVPEPSIAALLSLGGLALILRRRK